MEGSWELLGGLGSVLATSWEPSWRLWGGILGMSGPSWARKNMLKGEKILVKRPSHLDFNFGMIFDRFGSFFFGPRERNSIEKIVGFPVPEGFSPFLTRN